MLHRMTGWLQRRATSRGRKHDGLVRAPDAGDPHVRCDERGLETGVHTYRASPRLHQVVIPAKTEIQARPLIRQIKSQLDSRFRGNDGIGACSDLS